MKSRFALLATALLFVANQAIADDTKAARDAVVNHVMKEWHADLRAKLGAYCDHLWGSDYVMQKHCVDTQTLAKVKFERITAYNRIEKAPKSETAGILKEVTIAMDCQARWHDNTSDWFDYEMALHCYSEQVKAYNSLHQ